MLPEISIQLFSVRDQAGADYEGTIRAIAEMGFNNVETAGFPGSSITQAAKLFSELGIKAPSAHTCLPIGDNKNQIIEEAQAMGNKYLFTGCPANFSADFESIDTIKAAAETYCEAAEFASRHGIQVGYHNHDWDLADVDGTPGYRIFLDNTPEDVLFEADLFWVTKAGFDPIEFVKEIGVRGKVLHFKDGRMGVEGEFTEAETEDGKIMVSDSSPFLPAGTGDINLKGTAEVATHTEYVTVELDSYTGDMMKAVQESYTYLTTNKIARGRI